MSESNFSVTPIGYTRSEIKERKDAPLFYTDGGTPDVFIDILPQYEDGLFRMQPGNDIIIITWLHQSDRNVLQVHPRSNPANPLTGVFLTRSPDRPNPLGLHRAKILAIDGCRLHISAMEAIDGTPVVDIKPVVIMANDY